MPPLPARLSRALRPRGIPLSSVRKPDLCLPGRTRLGARSARGAEAGPAVGGLAVIVRSLPAQASRDALEDLSQDEAAARPPGRSGRRAAVGEDGEVVEGSILILRQGSYFSARGGRVKAVEHRPQHVLEEVVGDEDESHLDLRGHCHAKGRGLQTWDQNARLLLKRSALNPKRTSQAALGFVSSGSKAGPVARTAQCPLWPIA